MNKYHVFIDESGTAELSNYKKSPYFSLCAVIIDENNNKKLRKDFEQLKLKYFNRKNFVLHAVDLRWNLKVREKSLQKFSKDLEKIIDRCNFYIIYVLTKKEHALEKSWTSKTIYERSYQSLLSNLLEFLVKKNAKVEIFAEASNLGQDQYLYKAFVRLIQLGIKKKNISHQLTRNIFTSLCFVTKLNHDSGTQLADLFGFFGKLKTMEKNREA